MIISTGLISKYLTFSSRAKLCSFGQADDDNLFTSWWQFVYRLASAKRGDWRIVHTMVLTPTWWWWWSSSLSCNHHDAWGRWCHSSSSYLFPLQSLLRDMSGVVISGMHFSGWSLLLLFRFWRQILWFFIQKSNIIYVHPHQLGGNPWLQTDWTLRLENAPKPSTNSSKLVWPKR